MARIALVSLLALSALALCQVTSLAGAEAGMRCGSRLVSEGDSTYRVRSLCGDPDSAQRRLEFRTVRVPVARHPSGQGYLYAERTVEVQIDEWLYDFGPQKFVRRLTFEQDRLTLTVTEGYGLPR